MNPILVSILCLSVMPLSALSQGAFLFSNGRAPTRLGSIDGPKAGSGIWAHMMAGETVDTLAPVGQPAEHWGYGLVYGGPVMVPGTPAYSWTYVQMLAWDGALWGTNLAGVPTDQFGRTDAVRILLVEFDNATFAPPFTQPAIVPIPEPSVWVLGAVGGSVLALLQWKPARRRGSSSCYRSDDESDG